MPVDTSRMSEQELQFHYFKMHDADNNNKLDGCELVKSLIHWHGKIYKKNMFQFLDVKVVINVIQTKLIMTRKPARHYLIQRFLLTPNF
jgi:hypothetical protein